MATLYVVWLACDLSSDVDVDVDIDIDVGINVNVDIRPTK